MSSSPQTIVGLFEHQVNTRGSATALLERRGDKWHGTSWSEWQRTSRAVAAALIEEGVGPDDNVGIFSYSRRQWVEADMGVLLAGARTVTLYQNLNTETAHYILEDCGAQVLFVEGPLQLQAIFAGDGSILPAAVRRIIYFVDRQAPLKRPGQQPAAEVAIEDAVPAERRSLLLSFDEFIDGGRKALAAEPALLDQRRQVPKPDGVVKIVYTSGTTGEPKGAMLTHRNFLSVVDTLEEGVGLEPSDVTLLFLPLAHVYAQLVYHAALKVGFTIAFARSMLTVLDDAVEVCPHFFTSVPRLFEKIHAGILARVEADGGLKERIFHWAANVGRQVSVTKQRGEKPGAVLALQMKLADRAVFSKLKARLGGRVKYMISGGAPLARHLCEFFHAADMLILEGYGMTENASLSNYNPVDKVKFGTVGPAIVGMEQLIADDGEILIRGPNVMKGYWRKPELTAEVIDADGWLHTGDVGNLDEDGYLKITDRKKQIIVTSGGKNVPPAPIENALQESRFISQALVIGDQRSFLTALLTADADYLRAWAKERGLGGSDLKALSAHPELAAAVQADVDAVNADLDPFSTIKKFTVLGREFNLENDEMTPSLKLKRKVIEEHFRIEIETMYRRRGGVK